jgi:hypothetical protein
VINKLEFLHCSIDGYDKPVKINDFLKNDTYSICKIYSTEDAARYLGISIEQAKKIDSKLLSRYIKFAPLDTKYFARIYMDANISMENLNDLIESFLNSNALIMMASHPVRKYLIDELKACLSGGKISFKDYLSLKKISNSDLGNNLSQNGVYLRKQSDVLEKVFIDLIALLENKVCRDQLFLRGLLNDHKINYMLFDLEDYPINIIPHRTNFIKRLIKKVRFTILRYVLN